MHWNIPAFLTTLPIMAKGMAGIFLVTAVIVIAMLILRTLGKPKK